jgi:hypothetical protein
MSGIATASLLPEPPRRRHDEEMLHRGVVQFLRLALPANAFHFHIPNGGQRHTKAAARLVGLGVRAGVPDLCIVYAGSPIFIELKTARGALSAVQRQVIDRLRLCGAEVLICRSLPCVETALLELGVPLRASVAA